MAAEQHQSASFSDMIDCVPTDTVKPEEIPGANLITVHDIEWIPKMKQSTAKVRENKVMKLNTKLNLVFLYTDKEHKKDIYYFKVMNPIHLDIVKKDMEEKGLNPCDLYLPFWLNDNNECIIRFNLKCMADDIA